MCKEHKRFRTGLTGNATIAPVCFFSFPGENPCPRRTFPGRSNGLLVTGIGGDLLGRPPFPEGGCFYREQFITPVQLFKGTDDIVVI